MGSYDKVKNDRELRPHEMMNHIYKKNHKALIDKIKILVLDSLINAMDGKKDKLLTKKELVFIRDGVEKARSKEKEKEMKAITEVINSLIGRFGK